MGNRYQRLFRALEWAAHFTGLAPGRLDARSLVVAVLHRSGQQGFSDPSFVNPLTRLLRACDEEPDLSLFGCLAVRFDVLRCLNSLLQFDAAEEACPQIARRAIKRPIFIMGMPRGDSTFLQTLLSLVGCGRDFMLSIPARGFWRCVESRCAVACLAGRNGIPASERTGNPRISSQSSLVRATVEV